jgi:type I restriction enzyme R subunit
MSIHNKHKENQFETEIVNHLCNTSYIQGFSSDYDKELALYPSDLIDYIKNTQPVSYEKLSKKEGAKTDETLCNIVAKELDKKGSLYCLRNDIKDYRFGKISLCQFKPELENKELSDKYKKNTLRVVRQLYYSKDNTNSIDLVLFLNGIPIATCELKTDFTQNIQDAIIQYKKTRIPKNESLLEFKKDV